MSPVAPRAVPALPLPADAVVDPRIGSSGPCLLALEDGAVFRGVAFGADRARRWRPRRQHLADRLPGGLHRPQLRRPGRGHDLPAHRQPRPLRRRRPVGASLAERPGGRPCHGRRARAAPARSCTCCAPRVCPPSPAWTRARWRGTCARAARCAASSPRPARPTRRRPWPRPGPCRSGRSRTSSRRSRPARPIEVGDRGPVVAVVDLGLKTNIVRSLHRRGRARARPAAHRRPSTQVLAADVDGVVISPGPGDPGMLEGPVSLAGAVVADGRPLLGICLGHQIVARAAGATDAAAALRSPRRQPPGPRRGHPVA